MATIKGVKLSIEIESVEFENNAFPSSAEVTLNFINQTIDALVKQVDEIQQTINEKHS